MLPSYLTTIRGQESTASLSDAQLLDMRAEFEATVSSSDL